MNFALIGAAGYIAPRHLKAIKETENNLVCAYDIRDSVGILDRYFPECRFVVTRLEFDHVVRNLPDSDRVDYISICTPNHLHDNQCIDALRLGANAICEKPLAIQPGALSTLRAIEDSTGRKIYTIMQLRLNKSLIALRDKIAESTERHQVSVTYVTPRGRWYASSWKASRIRSGGLALNIGIHLFDLLLWVFGDPVGRNQLHISDNQRMAGFLELQRADVSWFLSTDQDDLARVRVGPKVAEAYRVMTVDGKEVSLSDGFDSLHTQSYKEILAGRGFGINDAEKSILFSLAVRDTKVTAPIRGRHHPYLSYA